MPKKGESSLEKLKKEYSKIQKRHSLPDFEEMNRDFGIEKLSETETEHLMREVRRCMAEKFSHYMRFVEIVLNPTNVPMIIFSIVKAITQEERNRLVEVYKKFSKMEVDLVEMELSFSEKKEAEFIRNSHKAWHEIEKDMLSVIEAVRKNWGSKFEGKAKGYFG
jgi:hypothetical protein